MKFFVFVAFVCCVVANTAAGSGQETKASSGKISKVVLMNENNWRDMMEGEWMIQFHAPWCPACQSIVEPWENLAQSSDEIGVKFGKIDVTVSPALSGRFFVTALPTIFHVINGEFRHYRGSRDARNIREFLELKEYPEIEPISKYSHPDSYQMSFLSSFFKISHILKDINDALLETYGFPIWLSYGIFAVATILCGALLGLLFVCIVDLIFPPKKGSRECFMQYKLKQQKELNAAEIVRGDNLDESTSEGEKNSGTDEEYDDEEDNMEDDAEDTKEDDVEVIEEEVVEKKPLSKKAAKKAAAAAAATATPDSPKKDDKKVSPTASPAVRKRKPRKVY